MKKDFFMGIVKKLIPCLNNDQLKIIYYYTKKIIDHRKIVKPVNNPVDPTPSNAHQTNKTPTVNIANDNDTKKTSQRYNPNVSYHYNVEKLKKILKETFENEPHSISLVRYGASKKGSSIFKCSRCGNEFETRNSVVYNLDRNHPKMFCPKCGTKNTKKYFKSEEEMLVYLNTKYEDDFEFIKTDWEPFNPPKLVRNINVTFKCKKCGTVMTTCFGNLRYTTFKCQSDDCKNTIKKELLIKNSNELASRCKADLEFTGSLITKKYPVYYSNINKEAIHSYDFAVFKCKHCGKTIEIKMPFLSEKRFLSENTLNVHIKKCEFYRNNPSVLESDIHCKIENMLEEYGLSKYIIGFNYYASSPIDNIIISRKGDNMIIPNKFKYVDLANGKIGDVKEFLMGSLNYNERDDKGV